MAYTPNTDLAGDAQYNLTPSQFKDKYVYQSLLQALVSEVQKLENQFSDMYSYRSISKAVGAQLDNIGTNMGLERRLNQDDDSYRTAIYSEIFMRRSDGTANYIAKSMSSIYGSDISKVKIFEHIASLTGGIVISVNQSKKIPSAVTVLKRLAAATVHSVVVLRDPTQQAYAWVPVEVNSDKNALVTENNDWLITDGGLGIIVQSGSGQLVKNSIGSFGDAGFNTGNLDLDTQVSSDATNRLGILNSNTNNQLLQVQKETAVGGLYGVMAEVSQIRRGHTEVEGEQ